MRNTFRQVFHSPKFMIGLIIFIFLLLMLVFYPLISPGNPLEMIGLGSFFKPGTYISVLDTAGTPPQTLKLPDAADKRLSQMLSDADRVSMLRWLTAAGVDESLINLQDTGALLQLWRDHYDPQARPAGMTMSDRRFYQRLNEQLNSAGNAAPLTLIKQDDVGEDLVVGTVSGTDYVNLADVANVRLLPLGTDNFGRDMLKELVSAMGTSIRIGFIAGLIATTIGLLLGLLSGYLGGFVDDIIMFFMNIFTVIPSFVLLILITYSIGQAHRGADTVAIVIGLTSWVWTGRSVRSQVISLRNRDHVNLSKLSGHSLMRIILTDILPYIASYVVMAFILQISSGILAEAQLSLLGLGPRTTEVPTLGLMMNWSMLYSAHINGAWWAYFPVILVITLITFSLNLMNTGLDQVFNPTLRD